jgi:hypothetical protein
LTIKYQLVFEHWMPSCNRARPLPECLSSAVRLIQTTILASGHNRMSEQFVASF